MTPTTEAGKDWTPRSLTPSQKRARERRRYAERRHAERREQQRRLRQCNDLIRVIASHGRKFFRHKGRIARLELDRRGLVWFVDAWSEKRIYLHDDAGYWRGFTGGGTLRELIRRLRDYVKRGRLLPARLLGPWPKWVCGGDLWGYGRDMAKVRKAAKPLLAPKRRWPPPKPKKKTKAKKSRGRRKEGT